MIGCVSTHHVLLNSLSLRNVPLPNRLQIAKSAQSPKDMVPKYSLQPSSIAFLVDHSPICHTRLRWDEILPGLPPLAKSSVELSPGWPNAASLVAAAENPHNTIDG